MALTFGYQLLPSTLESLYLALPYQTPFPDLSDGLRCE